MTGVLYASLTIFIHLHSIIVNQHIQSFHLFVLCANILGVGYCFSGNSFLQSSQVTGRIYSNFTNATGKQQVNSMHHDLQATDEIQYLQLTISIMKHREESVMKYGLEVASKCSVTGLLRDLIITVLNTFNA